MFNIIGAGMAGSMLADQLSKRGIEYRLFDSRESYAASINSENLFSDTWLKGTYYIDDSLDFLQSNYDIQKIDFVTNSGNSEVHYIPVNGLLRKKDVINERVFRVNRSGCETKSNFYEGVNICCAGYYSKFLYGLQDLDALTGHGFYYPREGNDMAEMMKIYRPYTHEKIMRIGGEVWYGDSTAIKHDNYVRRRKELINNSLRRARGNNLVGKPRIVFGARPMTTAKNKKEGYYRKVDFNNYIISGGWKDGLVIYPYLIKKLMKECSIW